MAQINERTNLPLKIVVPICLAILSSAFYLGAKMNQIENILTQVWTVDDMSQWGNDASNLNQNWKVPNARQIARERAK